MTYRLEINSKDHKDTLASSLRLWHDEHVPDMTLVPEDGLPIPAHSMIISLYSPSLRKILVDMASRNAMSLSVPTSASSISKLLHLLITGFLVGSTKNEMEEVKNTAVLLGIDLDCQIGYRKGIKSEYPESGEHFDIGINNSQLEEGSESVSCN